MTELHLLRHAHAGDPQGWNGPDDLRPLSEKGEKQADRLGRFLASVGFEPDAIVSSPKVRAARTAAIVAGHLGAKVALDPRLAGGLDLEAVEGILADAGDPRRPVLVGHDPDLTDLVDFIVGPCGLTMKKGAFIRIDTGRPLKPGGGTLRWFVPPDLLKPER